MRGCLIYWSLSFFFWSFSKENANKTIWPYGLTICLCWSVGWNRSAKKPNLLYFYISNILNSESEHELIIQGTWVENFTFRIHSEAFQQCKQQENWWCFDFIIISIYANGTKGAYRVLTQKLHNNNIIKYIYYSTFLENKRI